MDPVFDTTAWVIETVLVMVALLAAIPVLRAAAGLGLVLAARAFGFREGRLHRLGVALLPTFLRTALGVTAGLSVLAASPASAAQQPQPQPQIVIDRIVQLPRTPVVAPAAQRQAEASPRAVSKPISAAATPAPTRTALPRVTPLASPNATTSLVEIGAIGDPAGAPTGGSYRVQAGDSLWEIARQSLVNAGSEPTNRQVDRAWRELWQTNYDVIGSDPSLIRPGQVLQIPAALHVQ